MMDNSGKMVSKITLVVNRDFLTRSPVEIISELGVKAMGHVTGRAPVLNENRGVFKKIFRRTGGILQRPIDIITFLVEKELELQALQLVAERFKLNISGSGSVYSEKVSVFKSSGGLKVNTELSEPAKKMSMPSQLTGICCIVLRGEGDSVGRIALETGSCVPAITFGQGAGLRDRLGLWRITVPAEKEIVTMIVNSFEAEEIMNIIVDTIRLDQPGKGFIYQFPVSRGLINMKVSSESRSQAASMEQVIIAVDDLKGGTEWRRRRLSTLHSEKRRKLWGGLSEIALSCDEGAGEEYIKLAMDAGAPGATVTGFRCITDKASEISPAREKCSMIVSAKDARRIVKELDKAGVFSDGAHNDLVIRPVPGAFSYSVL